MADPVAFNRSAAERIARVVRDYERDGGDRGGKRRRRRPREDVLLDAKLTSRDGTDDRKYAWSEARPNSVGHEVVENGQTGTVTDGFAIDLTDPDIRTDLTDAFVVLGRGIYEGTEGPEACWYVLGYRLPKGEHQWMSMTMVTSNQWGAEMDRVHGLVPNPS